MVRNPQKRFAYEKARLLRKKGLSYNKIKKELGVSKSSVSLWCKDIKLTSEQIRKLADHSAANFKLGARANHEKRIREIAAIKESALREISELDRKTFKIAGAILYWAEGNKTNNASITNSDPRIIRLMVTWFEKTFDIPPTRLKAYLHIHYGNDEKKIKRFWSKLTGIPLKNFGKSFIKPKGTGHRTNILPNGIIRVCVLGKGAGNLRHRILFWGEKIYELSKIYQKPS